MLFNLNEYFLEWSSAPDIGLSLTWLLAGDLFWGTIKAVSTLVLGNAWMHIFTTHTFHLADAPLVARMFGVRQTRKVKLTNPCPIYTSSSAPALSGSLQPPPC